MRRAVPCHPAAAIGGVLLLAGPARAQPVTWTVIEERRIGPPAAEFASVTDVALDGAGRVWIADGMAGELHVAEADGSLRRVAGAGRGPGELSPGALELVVVDGDTVLVIEPHTRRMHRFGPEGVYVTTTTMTGEAGMTGGWRRLPDGRLAARVYPATVRLPEAQPAESGAPVRAFDTWGRAAEVLAMLPPTESLRMGTGPLPIITLLAPQPLWAVDERGGVLVASTHAYEVRLHGEGAAPDVVVRRDVSRNPVSDDVEVAARALLRESLAQRRTPPPVADRMVADALVAEEAPVMGGLMAGPDGTIWVGEPAESGEALVDLQQPVGRAWRVYDRHGEGAGRAVLPEGFQPLEWRGERLTGIARDALGRSAAVVLHITAR